MSKQLIYAIFVNLILGLLFVVSNYYVWFNVNKWNGMNIASIWDLFSITPYRIPNTPQVQMPINPLLNVPFMLFWVVIAVNLYFIIKLGRVKKKS